MSRLADGIDLGYGGSQIQRHLCAGVLPDTGQRRASRWTRCRPSLFCCRSSNLLVTSMRLTRPRCRVRCYRARPPGQLQEGSYSRTAGGMVLRMLMVLSVRGSRLTMFPLIRRRRCSHCWSWLCRVVVCPMTALLWRMLPRPTPGATALSMLQHGLLVHWLPRSMDGKLCGIGAGRICQLTLEVIDALLDLCSRTSLLNAVCRR